MTGRTLMNDANNAGIGLLPCPFCGAQDVGVGASQEMDDNDKYIEEGRRWSVLCSKCGASCSLNCHSEQDAVAQWNTRALRPEPSAADAISPTSEMLLAGARSVGNTMGAPNFMVRAKVCWEAMQAAREGKIEPKPGENGDAISPATEVLARPPSDDLLAFAIVETFGERCPTVDSDCYTCKAWAQYDAILALPCADEAAIRADERGKLLNWACERLLVLADGWKANPSKDKCGADIALINAAMAICGRGRIAANRYGQDRKPSFVNYADQNHKDLLEECARAEALEARALAAEARLAEALRLLTRYRNETPLGNQPHMIAHEVDAFTNAAKEKTDAVD